MPAVQRLSSRKPPAALVVAEAGPTASEEPPTPTSAPSSAKSVAHWSKKLSRSDAQRRAGHQSNLIALTQGDYRSRIDQTSFFREDLFGSEAWTSETTTSREPIEVTYAPIRTRIDGVDHGVLTFRITHAIHRESGTNSPTTELHLEPIAALFALSDMTGKTARIERYDDGSYSLTIS